MGELERVDHLIEVMNGTKPLSQQKRDGLWQEHWQRTKRRMLTEGISYNRASGGPEFLNQRDEKTFRAFIRKTDQDLDWQCETVEEAFDRHLKTGEIPAPHYPMRIAILLRKAKETEREKGFLEAWCRHFPAGPGVTYAKLVKRAKKTGVSCYHDEGTTHPRTENHRGSFR